MFPLVAASEEARKKLQEPNGDLLVTKASKYLQVTPPNWAHEEWPGQMIPLSVIRLNPWASLDNLGILSSDLLNRSEYQCPYTGYKHYSVVPIVLVSRNLEQYRKRLDLMTGKADFALDWEFHRQMNSRERAWQPHIVLQMFLGSGYTLSQIANDGSHELKKAAVEVSNGDMLGVLYWRWFNK